MASPGLPPPCILVNCLSPFITYSLYPATPLPPLVLSCHTSSPTRPILPHPFPHSHAWDPPRKLLPPPNPKHCPHPPSLPARSPFTPWPPSPRRKLTNSQSRSNSWLLHMTLPPHPKHTPPTPCHLPQQELKTLEELTSPTSRGKGGKALLLSTVPNLLRIVNSAATVLEGTGLPAQARS